MGIKVSITDYQTYIEADNIEDFTKVLAEIKKFKKFEAEAQIIPYQEVATCPNCNSTELDYDETEDVLVCLVCDAEIGEE